VPSVLRARHDAKVTCDGCSATYGEIIKNLFPRREKNLLQNDVLNFVFRLNQSSGIALES